MCSSIDGAVRAVCTHHVFAPVPCRLKHHPPAAAAERMLCMRMLVAQAVGSHVSDSTQGHALAIPCVTYLRCKACTLPPTTSSPSPLPNPCFFDVTACAEWCDQLVPGCSECYEEQLQPAPGVPHMKGGNHVTVLRCTACAEPLYKFNTNSESCGECCCSSPGPASGHNS